MIKITVTNAVISKGYGEKPSLQFSQKDGATTAVRFRIGQRVFDKEAENNTRWVNMNVKAFGKLAERIHNMKLDAGSTVNLSGRLDEETWDEKGITRRAFVLIVDDIEYAGGNGDRKQGAHPQTGDAATAGASQQAAPEGGGGFDGFVAADGGGNGFF